MEHTQHDAQPSDNGNEVQHLCDMTPQERQDLYEEYFSREVPIEKMKRPKECHDHPHLKNEILEAYLKYTTWVFKVWINYDAACEKLYTDARIHDCGQLMLSPKAMEYLSDIGAGAVELRNVRLDIGTAFQTLAHLTLEVRPSKLDVGPKIDTYVNDLGRGAHPIVMKVINRVRTIVEDSEADATGGKNGFTIEDLEKVAAKVVLRPDLKVEMKRGWDSYKGPWMHKKEGYLYCLDEDSLDFRC